jgi:beta-glucuronidase
MSLGEEVVISLPELNLRVVTAIDDSGTARFSVPADVELWSPATPRLYDVLITSKSDRIYDRIGFRTI